MEKILFIILISSFGLTAQQNIVDSLEKELNIVEKRINSLTAKKRAIQSALLSEKQNSNKTKTGNGFTATVGVLGGAIWSEPNIYKGESLGRLNKGETVTAYEMVDDVFIRVDYKGINGYMVLKRFEPDRNITSIISSENPKLANLIRQYGYNIAGRIDRGEVWIGMTKEMASKSIGSPSNTTRTRFEWGLSETWYYQKGYETYKILHFDNGKLKIISDY